MDSAANVPCDLTPNLQRTLPSFAQTLLRMWKSDRSHGAVTRNLRISVADMLQHLHTQLASSLVAFHCEEVG